jgi:hypothetical protein
LLKGVLARKKTIAILLIVTLALASTAVLVFSALNAAINAQTDKRAVPSFAPSNITYAVPIVLLNNQPVNTPSPFQQMITVDSTNYGNYAASNLQNIEFFDSNGAVIPSWLELGNSNSSTNTIYWLKLANGIAANSNITIYMGFASKDTNFFNSQLVGEAPTLSSIYGQYDNGADVFNVYADFGGSTMPVDWSLLGSAIFIPSTGVETVNGTYDQMGAVVYNKSIYQDMVIDASTFFSGSGDNQNIGFYSSGLPNGTGGPPGTGNIVDQAGGLTNIGYSATFDPRYGTAVLYQDGNTSLTSSYYTYPSAYSYSCQQIAISSNLVHWKFVSQPTEYYAANYNDLTEVYNYEAGASNALGGHNSEIDNNQGGLYFSSTTGYGTSTQYIYWLRIRALPPNEIMPAVGFNGVIQSPKIDLAVSVSSYSATVSGLAIAASGNYISSYSWSWGDGETSTGAIPQTHWYSDSGNYTITLTVTDSGGLTNTVATSANVGPSIYTTPKPSTITLTETPAWAFNGSYAEYKATGSYSGTSVSATVKFMINDVDLDAQTCTMSMSYSDLGASVGTINQSASFAQPPFFIASPTALSSLNNGEVPSTYTGGKIDQGVSVSVPAGTFITDKITISEASEWIDSKSGLIVKISGSIPGDSTFGLGSSAQMELTSTNIPSSGGSSLFGANNPIGYFVLAAVIIGALIVGILLYRIRKTKPTTITPGMPTSLPPPPAPSQTTINSFQSIDKMRRLKVMLDRGLISQQEYDEQKSKFLEKFGK